MILLVGLKFGNSPHSGVWMIEICKTLVYSNPFCIKQVKFMLGFWFYCFY